MNKETYLTEYPKHESMRENVKKDKNRLHFHMMPPTGWMNDPNGLCEFQGVNHIYFQYTPFLAGWGTKLWGHYTTKDWIHYKEEEPFLYPDEEWDRDGVYSGSAYTCEDGIHYFYTGNVKLWDKDYDYIMNGREQNTIHVFSPDGKNIAYKKLVMTNDDYPVNMSKHVRDPKIYKKDGRYYMIQGGRDAESYGCALLFCSDDLEHWKWYDTVRTAKPFGYMWECPDLFRIDGNLFLSISPQGIAAEEYQYQNVYQYYKGLIAFRKAHPVLRLDNAEDVKAHVTPVEDLDDNVVAFAITGDVDGETADGMYVIFNANNEKKEVTLPEGNWNVCINDTLAGTDTIETISGTAEVAPVSALILVKGDGNGSTAVVSAGTLPAWMAYVFTILVAVVIGACSVWSQKKAGKAGRK